MAAMVELHREHAGGVKVGRRPSRFRSECDLKTLAPGGEGETLIQAHHLQGRPVLACGDNRGSQLERIGGTKRVDAERALCGRSHPFGRLDFSPTRHQDSQAFQC